MAAGIPNKKLHPRYGGVQRSLQRSQFKNVHCYSISGHRNVEDGQTDHFGITYGKDGEPVCDDAFYNYVLELDDATKVLNDKDGNPVNFGSMSMDQFLEARNYADNNQLEKILDM